jgi:hypothetical protein
MEDPCVPPSTTMRASSLLEMSHAPKFAAPKWPGAPKQAGRPHTRRPGTSPEAPRPGGGELAFVHVHELLRSFLLMEGQFCELSAATLLTVDSLPAPERPYQLPERWEPVLLAV